MDSAVYELLAIIVLIIANGFFAASEFALIASRRARIKNMAARGDKRAIKAKNVLDNPDRFLAAIQVGITFIGTLAGVFGGATLVRRLTLLLKEVPMTFISNAADPISIALVVAFIAFMSVVIGELIPKYLALINPEKMALRVVTPIDLFSKVVFVVVSILTWSARFTLRLFGLSGLPERGHITEDEINILIKEGTEKGVFDQTEQKLIKSVFDFTDITARQAMTPRVDFKAIKVDWPKGKILETVTASGYSRYPVYEDSPDDIIGIVYTKDLLKVVTLNNGAVILKDILRKPLFVPDSMPLTVLLDKMRKRKVHISIVLDEFGGTAGLITLEDILEEIVGEIQDEHDVRQPEFVAHSDKVAFVAASLRPDELNELFGAGLPEDISDTLAGLMIEKMGRVPDISSEVIIGNVKFRVLEKDGIRIKRIKVEKVS